MSASTVSRARIARRQAKALGLRVVARGDVVELRDDTGQLLAGGLGAVETYLVEWYTAKRPGPRGRLIPAALAPMIDDYCLTWRPLGRPRRRSGCAGCRWRTSPAAWAAHPSRLPASSSSRGSGDRRTGAQRLAATTAARPRVLRVGLQGRPRPRLAAQRKPAPAVISATVYPPTRCGVTRWPQSF